MTDTTTRRLYRSRQHRMIFGVASGLGQYFSVDPTLVRLGFVVAFLLPGVGGVALLSYVIMAIVVPVRPLGELEPPLPGTAIDTSRARQIGGYALLALGTLALAGTLGLYRFFEWISWQYVIPAGLIILGAFLLMRNRD